MLNPKRTARRAVQWLFVLKTAIPHVEENIGSLRDIVGLFLARLVFLSRLGIILFSRRFATVLDVSLHSVQKKKSKLMQNMQKNVQNAMQKYTKIVRLGQTHALLHLKEKMIV